MHQIFLYHLKVTVHMQKNYLANYLQALSGNVSLSRTISCPLTIYRERDYSNVGATSVGLDSKTSEFDASGSSKSSRDWIDSLYAGVALKSVAPSLYVATAIPHAISCSQDTSAEYK